MSLTASVVTGGSHSHQTTSQEANNHATDFVDPGVVGAITNSSGVAPMTGSFAVNAQGTPDNTVAVSSGQIYVTTTPTGQASQCLRVNNSATVNVTIASNASGSTKYDFIYVKVDPDKAVNPDSAADDVASIYVSRSSSSTSDNGTPPAFGTLIAVVAVANGFVTLTNGTITDKRVRTGANAASPNLPQTFVRPYAFSVYRNSALTDGSGAFALIGYDTAEYDIGSNVDIVTNKGRFTAPIAGYYWFNAHVCASVTSGSTTLLGLYKNGSLIKVLDQRNAGANNTLHGGATRVKLAAGDYVEVFHWGTGGTVVTGSQNTYFEGYLDSV